MVAWCLFVDIQPGLADSSNLSSIVNIAGLSSVIQWRLGGAERVIKATTTRLAGPLRNQNEREEISLVFKHKF